MGSYRNFSIASKSLGSFKFKVLTSTVQRLASRTQCPASRVQSPASRIQNLATRIHIPKSSVCGPVSRIQRPWSSAHGLESRIQRPESIVQSPVSRVQRLEFNVQLFRPESGNSGISKMFKLVELFFRRANEIKTCATTDIRHAEKSQFTVVGLLVAQWRFAFIFSQKVGKLTESYLREHVNLIFQYQNVISTFTQQAFNRSTGFTLDKNETHNIEVDRDANSSSVNQEFSVL